jgi:hypothetical protein
VSRLLLPHVLPSQQPFEAQLSGAIAKDGMEREFSQFCILRVASSSKRSERSGREDGRLVSPLGNKNGIIKRFSLLWLAPRCTELCSRCAKGVSTPWISRRQLFFELMVGYSPSTAATDCGDERAQNRRSACTPSHARSAALHRDVETTQLV